MRWPISGTRGWIRGRCGLCSGRCAWVGAVPPQVEIERFLPHHEAVLAPYRESDWASTPPQGLLAALDPLIEAHGACWWYNFVIQVNMMVRQPRSGAAAAAAGAGCAAG